MATSYVTDVNSPAIPALNVLNVLGDDTTTNNVNGIRTDGSSGSNTLTVQLTNRISVTSTTSDGAGQTQTVALFTPSNDTSIAFTMLVTGYDAANDETKGGQLVGIARNDAGTLTVVGTNDTFNESDSGLMSADWDVIDTASPVLEVEFMGVAGRSIVWRAVFEYTQAP